MGCVGGGTELFSHPLYTYIEREREIEREGEKVREREGEGEIELSILSWSGLVGQSTNQG